MRCFSQARPDHGPLADHRGAIARPPPGRALARSRHTPRLHGRIPSRGARAPATLHREHADADPAAAATLGRVLRLWAAVLVANVAATWLMAEAIAHSEVFTPEVKTAFSEISTKTISHPFST